VPLDPEAKLMLETISGGEEVDPFTLPHTLIREGFAAMAGLGQGPEVAKVEEREADGPAGKIPVRIYTPAGEGPKPGLV
jgi:acetyl esterase